jgi:hypothetical protein
LLQLLGNWHRVAGEIAQAYPNIASQMTRIADATREAMTAMVTPSPATQESNQ